MASVPLSVEQLHEAALIQAARARLPAAAERRLKRLIGGSERGELTPDAGDTAEVGRVGAGR